MQNETFAVYLLKNSCNKNILHDMTQRGTSSKEKDNHEERNIPIHNSFSLQEKEERVTMRKIFRLSKET